MDYGQVNSARFSSQDRRRAASRPWRWRSPNGSAARIVNADSMQVYRDLRVLTARPSEAETREAPHVLFGEVDGAENFSVGRWLERARALLEEARGVARPLIFVGGTGLYFRALTEGLSDIPRVPEEVRARVRAEAEALATPALHERLAGARPADRRKASPERPPARAARARSHRRDRPAARRVPGRARSRPRWRRANGRACSLRPTATRSTRASPVASPRCCARARLRKSRRWRRGGSILRCP